MPKSDFNKVAVRHGCSPVNLLPIFRTPFPRNTSGWLPLNIEHILRENFSIHVSCKHYLDCNKTLFLLLLVILPVWGITSNGKSWKSFVLSFSKLWSLSSGNKSLTSSANALTVLLFRGGSVGIWVGLTHINTEGQSLVLFLP